MWLIIGGTDTTSTAHPERCTEFSLDFVDGSIQLEYVPEVSGGDLEVTSFDLIQDTLNQSSELDTRLILESISLDLISSLSEE